MIFVDGFDHYTTAVQGGRKWDAWSGDVQPSGGRNNSPYLSLTQLNNSVQKNFAATNHVILQYGIRVPVFANNLIPLCTLTSPLGGAHSALFILSDGSIQYKRGATQIAISAGGTVSGGVWHYIEMEQTLSTGGASTGSCVVKLNGATILNLSSISNNDDLVELPTILSIGGVMDVDDLVLVTGSEVAPFNTLFGDWAVRTLFTNGAGSSTQFTPVPVVANYLNVDETTPDDDITYVQSGTVGERDLYAMTDLPAAVVSVLGVAATPTIRKSDAGTRQFANVVHRAGSSTVGSTLTCTSAYAAGLQTMFRFDPVTGVAPTPAQVNAYEAGYDVVT